MAKSKGKRKRRNDSLVLQLMILVAVVLVVFEGKLVITMVTHRASTSGTQSAGSKDKGTTADGTETEVNRIKIWHWRRQQTEMAIFLFWQGFRRERER